MENTLKSSLFWNSITAHSQKKATESSKFILLIFVFWLILTLVYLQTWKTMLVCLGAVFLLCFIILKIFEVVLVCITKFIIFIEKIIAFTLKINIIIAVFVGLGYLWVQLNNSDYFQKFQERFVQVQPDKSLSGILNSEVWTQIKELWEQILK